jgi:hypothetical protein
MSLLSWNGRGLGQPQTVQELTRLVCEFGPSIIFLSEIRQHKDRVCNLMSRLGLNKCFVVDGQGKGGGLALYWLDSIKVDILSYGMHHIDTIIWDDSHHARWRGTFIYGEPNTHHKHVMWELIRRIKPRSQAPWLMIGDLNESMWSFEHMSAGRRRSKRQMLEFRELLLQCDLHDLGFRGRPWTFDNKQEGEKNVKVRLDRAIASPSWSEWFPNASFQHVVSSRSDHCPILLSMELDENMSVTRQLAQYEIMWEREPSLPEEIKEAWASCRNMLNLEDMANSLCNVMCKLKAWSHN